MVFKKVSGMGRGAADAVYQTMSLLLRCRSLRPWTMNWRPTAKGKSGTRKRQRQSPGKRFAKFLFIYKFTHILCLPSSAAGPLQVPSQPRVGRSFSLGMSAVGCLSHSSCLTPFSCYELLLLSPGSMGDQRGAKARSTELGV